MPPLVIAGAIGAIGSVAGGALSANAAGKAAQTQANAANYAANLEYQSGQNALGFQEAQYNNQNQMLAPYLQAGYGGLANLQNLLGIAPQGNYVSGPQSIQNGGTGPMSNLAGGAPGAAPGASTGAPRATGTPGPLAAIANAQNNAPRVPAPNAPVPGAAPTAPTSNLVNPSLGAFGSLSQGWNQQFEAPTDVTEQNDPGYKFRMQQGVNALQNSAAARGTLLSGGTAAGINAYGQDYGSNEYSNVYNRKLGEYQQAYNIFQQNQANQYNRLASLAGVGQVTAGQLGSAGQQTANSIGNILTGTASNIGNQVNNAAAATASGYAGQANAWGGALNNVSNLAQIYALSRQPGNASQVDFNAAG